TGALPRVRGGNPARHRSSAPRRSRRPHERRRRVGANVEGFSSIAQMLQATGPYGLVAILGWAFWRVNEKKDRELKVLGEKVVAMAEAQTAAIIKVEAALVALRDA